MSKPVIKQQTISSRLDRNIAALLERRRQEAATATLQEKAAAAITRFAGSMIFVYIHALVFGGWIVINVGLLPILPAFDPSMVVLAMVASVEAIFISTFVMISQNRMAEADDKRADLNLQISLLAEHETTQLLSIVTAIAENSVSILLRSRKLQNCKRMLRRRVFWTPLTRSRVDRTAGLREEDRKAHPKQIAC